MSKKISLAQINDIPWMVDLSEIKRSDYQKYQPNFWKKNPNSFSIQSKYFEELLIDKNIIALVLYHFHLINEPIRYL